MLRPYEFKSMTLKNRFVMAPMCTVCAKDGYVNNHHFVHYGSASIGQVGLIIVEACSVSDNGMIKKEDLSISNDSYIEGLKSLVDYAHSNGSKMGIQLGHAGPKSLVNKEIIYSPSGLKFDENTLDTTMMNQEQINQVIEDFKQASIRAVQAGFDFIEIHGAHGYLISSFLSPLTNIRTDAYQNKTLFLEQIIDAITSVWPEDKGLSLRISANDYHEEGHNATSMAYLLKGLPNLNKLDFIHVSSGGVGSVKPKVYPGYQLNDALIIKNITNIDVIAVGVLEDINMLEYAFEQDISLIALGRAFLKNPYYLSKLKQEENPILNLPILNI